MNRTSIRISTTALAVVMAAALTAVPGKAQRIADRQSGPRDWSHGRVVATRFGPDQDRLLKTNWRTVMKHAQIERMRAGRSPDGSPTKPDGRLDTEQRRPSSPARDLFRNERERLARQEAVPHLDWSLNTGGYGSVVGSPAKFSFDITASNCSDDVYFTVDQDGAASTVNVIGLTNVYGGCLNNATGATPTVKFGIRMGSGTATSAVPSFDGTVLYVIESRASGGVVLHALNVDSITSNPGTYTYATKLWSAAHTLSTSPIGTAASEQLFEIAFPSTVVNNLASPYLDYDGNQLFFGDSSGRIHRVAGVNLPSASRDTTNFPVSCGNAALQSPVFVNGQVISTSADGRLYRIDTTLAPPYTCVASSQSGNGTASGVAGALSAPVVDVSNSKVLIVSNDAAASRLAGIAIYDLMFASGAAATGAALLGEATTTAPSAPTFDNDFWSTNNGSVYGVGAPNGGTTHLVRFPYNGTTLGTAAGFASLTRSGGPSTVATTPVTEFLTASTLANPDFVFVGGGGDNYKFINRIGSGFTGSGNSPKLMAGSFAVPGGVISGIIIDTRTAGVTGSMATANVYFGTVGIASTTMSTIVQLAQQF